MGGEKELGASLNLQWNGLKDVFLNRQPKIYTSQNFNSDTVVSHRMLIFLFLPLSHFIFLAFFILQLPPGNSNLARTRTKIDFPLDFLHTFIIISPLVTRTLDNSNLESELEPVSPQSISL